MKLLIVKKDGKEVERHGYGGSDVDETSSPVVSKKGEVKLGIPEATFELLDEKDAPAPPPVLTLKQQYQALATDKEKISFLAKQLGLE